MYEEYISTILTSTDSILIFGLVAFLIIVCTAVLILSPKLMKYSKQKQSFEAQRFQQQMEMMTTFANIVDKNTKALTELTHTLRSGGELQKEVQKEDRKRQKEDRDLTIRSLDKIHTRLDTVITQFTNQINQLTAQYNEITQTLSKIVMILDRRS